MYIFGYILYFLQNILYIDRLGSFCILGKKFDDPLPGRNPSVEKHCSKAVTLFMNEPIQLVNESCLFLITLSSKLSLVVVDILDTFLMTYYESSEIDQELQLF